MSAQLAVLLWLPGMVLAAYVGHRLGSRSPRPTKAPEHAHIWSPWTEERVTWVDDGGTELYKGAAQKRDCLDCGYQERRKLR